LKTHADILVGIDVSNSFFVSFMGQAGLDRLNQVETMRKFESRGGADVSMAVVMEFNPKEVLKEVLI
jgi:hypothetical protein